jgi:hypothetical protein
MENWNDSIVLSGNEQRMSVQLAITVRTSRLTLFLIGFGLMVSGVIVAYISVRLKNRIVLDSS